MKRYKEGEKFTGFLGRNIFFPRFFFRPQPYSEAEFFVYFYKFLIL